MITTKKRSQIQESLNRLDKTDVYSLMLFTLYKMRDIPEYSTLGELSYVLNGDNLVKLLSYFGGMTIKIPTLREMRLVTQALLLYEYVNLNDGELKDALTIIAGDEFKPDELLEVYSKIVEVVSKYDFERN